MREPPRRQESEIVAEVIYHVAEANYPEAEENCPVAGANYPEAEENCPVAEANSL